MTIPSELEDGERLIITFPPCEGKPSPIQAVFLRDYSHLELQFQAVGDPSHPGKPFITFHHSQEDKADSILENWLYDEHWEGFAPSDEGTSVKVEKQ